MFIIIVALIINVFADRIHQPTTKIYFEHIPSQQYNGTVDQDLYLNYNSYPGVFDLQLSLIKSNNGSQVLEDRTFQDFEAIEVKEKPIEGCFAQQRELQVIQNLGLNLQWSGSERVYFSDIETAPTVNRAYLVRTDFLIFEIELHTSIFDIYKIELSNTRKSFANLLNVTNIQQHYGIAVPSMIKDTIRDTIYILTSLGAVSFSVKNSLDSTQFSGFKKEDAFIKRNLIHKIHYNENHEVIFVACGQEGIDIYDTVKGTITFLRTLTATDFQLEEGTLNVMDVNSDTNEKLLYVLDYERGLLVVDITDLKKIRPTDMHVEISRARSFSFYENTFFIVAQTQNNQDFAIELFIDIPTNSYYFNRYYMDEMTIYDVQVFDFFAVLIGYDAHKVVYHSLYGNFINTTIEEHTYFQESNLQKIKLMTIENKKHFRNHFFVGISKYEFKIFKVYSRSPTIICRADSVFNEYYEITMQSTNCNSKTDKSSFSKCTVVQRFNFFVQDVIDNTSKATRYAIVIYLLLFIIAWLAVITCVCYKKWNRIIRFLNWKDQKLRQTSPYNDFGGEGAQQGVEMKPSQPEQSQ